MNEDYEPNHIHMQQLTECEDRQERLSEWEARFVADVGEMIMHRPLTESQAIKLSEIHQKAVLEGD